MKKNKFSWSLLVFNSFIYAQAGSIGINITTSAATLNVGIPVFMV